MDMDESIPADDRARTTMKLRSRGDAQRAREYAPNPASGWAPTLTFDTDCLLPVTRTLRMCVACSAIQPVDRQAVPVNDGYTSAEKGRLAAACWDGSQHLNTTAEGTERGVKNR